MILTDHLWKWKLSSMKNIFNNTFMYNYKCTVQFLFFGWKLPEIELIMIPIAKYKLRVALCYILCLSTVNNKKYISINIRQNTKLSFILSIPNVILYEEMIRVKNTDDKCK